LKPKGVTLGRGKFKPSGASIELKKSTGNLSSINNVILKLNSEGGDCIELKY